MCGSNRVRTESFGVHSSRDQDALNLGGFFWPVDVFRPTSEARSGTLTVGVLVNAGDTLNFYSSISTSARDNGYYIEEVAPVPVPAAIWFFSAGLMGMLGIGHRKTAVNS